MGWKCKKTWPIEVTFADNPLKVVCHSAPAYLYVEVNMMINIRDRKSRSKIDLVQIELVGNGSSHKEHEWEAMLTDKPLKDVSDGLYTTNFKIFALKPYFVEWSKGNLPAEDVFGTIELGVGKLLCKTKPSSTINRIIV